MVRYKRNYALEVLRDEGGYLGAIVTIASFIYGMFSSHRQKQKAWHERKEQIGLAYQQAEADRQTELDKLDKQKELNDQSIRAMEAASFQKGSAMGPFFRVVQ